jgi:hypothetical protein
MFASASPDNIKQWTFPDGEFVQNLSGHNNIINSLVVNQDGVMVSGGKCACYLFISAILWEFVFYLLARMFL